MLYTAVILFNYFFFVFMNTIIMSIILCRPCTIIILCYIIICAVNIIDVYPLPVRYLCVVPDLVKSVSRDMYLSR